jgi:hypothetical protein
MWAFEEELPFEHRAVGEDPIPHRGEILLAPLDALGSGSGASRDSRAVTAAVGRPARLGDALFSAEP